LEEADLIRLDGDRLYALSAHRGLLVFDVSDPADLRILGSYAVNGTPFEMHLRGGVALVQFSQFWQYDYDANTGAGAFQMYSQLLALDVTDPAEIRLLGQFSIPGELGDSRLVGDILYLVSGQVTGCAGCHLASGVSVLSVDVTDPTAPVMVERVDVSFPGANALARRAVHFSASRIYVGGLPVDGHRSRIQVIDISDPRGTMSLGAQLEVDGQIRNRWQMDEADGVLRVVGQSDDWQYAPVVSTFEIRASDDLRPLDILPLDMPQPETLRSVRFDGTRAYIITYQIVIQQDPLFIVDCSDPSNLVQQGHYEMPGWVYHIEPRGDRLITLGYANDEGGALTVSLFDVSDPWNPDELARQWFGGESIMAEDQSRIHKAMQVYDDRGWILVPYGLRTPTADVGRVRLFSFTRDTVEPITELGTAGTTRRAFLRDDTLFAFSSEQLATWNLAEPAQPAVLDRLDLVEPVYSMEPVGGGLVAVLTQNAWTSQSRLAIHDRTDAAFQAPRSVIDLSEHGIRMVPRTQYYWAIYAGAADTHLFADGDVLHLLYVDTEGQSYGVVTGLASFDLSNPEAPVLLGLSFWPGLLGRRDVRREQQVSVEGGDMAVMVNGVIVYRPRAGELPLLEALDVRDPANPVRHFWYVNPRWELMQSMGTLIPRGDSVFFSYYLYAGGQDETGDWVDYQLTELNLADPDAPDLVEHGGIPGSLVGLTPSAGELVTVDYRRENRYSPSWEDCLTRGLYPKYDPAFSRCHFIRHHLKVVSRDDPMGAPLQEFGMDERWIRDVQTTQTRVFFTSYEEPVYAGFPIAAPTGWFHRRPRLHAISLQEGNPNFEQTAVVDLPHPYAFLYWAHGNHAVVAADAPPMLIHLRNPQPGEFRMDEGIALGGYVYDVVRDGDRLHLALGLHGPRTVPFED